ncbi:MAG: 3'(2'),5'-bisphosphate nucleotidase [Alphaproteobacteria bacterium]|nr:3'(2'),5'-bisphosphate nucleotidase [Alphaproteobacteria bacterium]|tara:strand:- start:1481 stop:2314 length:834 start_codon:yes stop_codon:yes gene_type:complete
MRLFLTLSFLICTLFITPLKSQAADWSAEDIIAITHQAGEILLAHYNKVDNTASEKADHSPVTSADKESNTLIVAALQKLTPDIPVISEESAATAKIDNIFWLVDPMDGTKSFINRTGQFTVNIALIEDQKPVFGVVYIPLSDITYYNDRDGKSHKREGKNTAAIHTRSANKKDGLTLVASQLHRSADDDAFIAANNIKDIKTMSSSIKFCLIAEGKADIYPRYGTTMEWDTAAGHAILKGAGGHVVVQGSHKELLYKKKDFKNPHFIAFGNISDYP